MRDLNIEKFICHYDESQDIMTYEITVNGQNANVLAISAKNIYCQIKKGSVKYMYGSMNRSYDAYAVYNIVDVPLTDNMIDIFHIPVNYVNGNFKKRVELETAIAWSNEDILKCFDYFPYWAHTPEETIGKFLWYITHSVDETGEHTYIIRDHTRYEIMASIGYERYIFTPTLQRIKSDLYDNYIRTQFISAIQSRCKYRVSTLRIKSLLPQCIGMTYDEVLGYISEQVSFIACEELTRVCIRSGEYEFKVAVENETYTLDAICWRYGYYFDLNGLNKVDLLESDMIRDDFTYVHPTLLNEIRELSGVMTKTSVILSQIDDYLGCDFNTVCLEIARSSYRKNVGPRCADMPGLRFELPKELRNLIVGIDKDIDFRPNDIAVRIIWRSDTTKAERIRMVRLYSKEILRFAVGYMKSYPRIMNHVGSFGCYRAKFHVLTVPQVELVFSVKDELIIEEEV